MPSDIQGILLVPAQGDPHGLLKEGPCGARPPMAISGHLCGYEEHRNWKSPEDYEYHSDCYMCGSVKSALVLAWDGQPVFQGYSLLDGYPDEIELEIDRVLRGQRKTLSFVESDVTVVFVDAEGREVIDE